VNTLWLRAQTDEEWEQSSVPGDYKTVLGEEINKKVRKDEKKKQSYVRPQQIATARLLPLLNMFARVSAEQVCAA
jgi:hypothetical protein